MAGGLGPGPPGPHPKSGPARALTSQLGRDIACVVSVCVCVFRCSGGRSDRDEGASLLRVWRRRQHSVSHAVQRTT